jgi:hypothetical protein
MMNARRGGGSSKLKPPKHAGVLKRLGQLSYLDLRVVMAIMWTTIAMTAVFAYVLVRKS